MAQKQAAKHKSELTKDDDHEENQLAKPRIVIEDLGGAPVDLDEDAGSEFDEDDATGRKQELSMLTSSITRVLTRTAAVSYTHLTLPTILLV